MKTNLSLSKSDLENFEIKELISGIESDERQFEEGISLAAFENKLSKTAQQFLSSPLSFRYHLGTLDDVCADKAIIKSGLMFQGLPGTYALQKAAELGALSLFGAEDCDLRPLSGLHAMISSIASLTDPKDIVYSIDPQNGGHFATKHIVERFGRKSKYLPWNTELFSIDCEKFKRQIKNLTPKAVFLDHGIPLFKLPVSDLRSILPSTTLLIYDASHTLGLIAGGQFQDPFREGCDVLQGNTHKSFPGPQKGMILFKDKNLAKSVKQSISAGLLSSQHTHHSIAQYITILEMEKFAAEYASQTIKNSLVLADELEKYGLPFIRINGIPTTSHVLLADGESWGGSYNVCRLMMDIGISSNARPLFGKILLRFGSQELTRRGMKENDMKHISSIIHKLVMGLKTEVNLRHEIKELAQSFQKIHYSFDDLLKSNVIELNRKLSKSIEYFDHTKANQMGRS